MFETGIFCVIFLAVAYWAVLWLMGRRNDVLHGEFVKSEPHAEEPVRPVFPKRPVRSAPPERPAEAAPVQPAFRQERLESLLNTIKQDLNQLVQR
ncbi:hypothetical protein [Bradyrhizobium sp. AZCC 1693]|uniref:hypothetical protein n=1 Tax=Bradyrhizobium sp. AZCC 1693 TaxID=3117029 RepID=UPI002FF22AB7